MTNFEKIQTMGLYEMIGFLDRYAGCGVCSLGDGRCHSGVEDSVPCREHIKEWLESEVDD